MKEMKTMNVSQHVELAKKELGAFVDDWTARSKQYPEVYPLEMTEEDWKDKEYDSRF